MYISTHTVCPAQPHPAPYWHWRNCVCGWDAPLWRTKRTRNSWNVNDGYIFKYGLLLWRMLYTFRHFHKAIIRHRHKNVTEKNLKGDLGFVHPVVFRVQQLYLITSPSTQLNKYTNLCRRWYNYVKLFLRVHWPKLKIFNSFSANIDNRYKYLQD